MEDASVNRAIAAALLILAALATSACASRPVAAAYAPERPILRLPPNALPGDCYYPAASGEMLRVPCGEGPTYVDRRRVYVGPDISLDAPEAP